MSTARLACVVILVAGCGTAGKQSSTETTSAGERTRGTCEAWLRHNLDIERQAELAIAERTGEPARTESESGRRYDEIRQRTDFLEYCNRLPDAYFTCAMRARKPEEMSACEPLVKGEDAEP